MLKILAFSGAVIILMVSIVSFAPSNFPKQTQIHIAQATTLAEAGKLLAEKHIISSPFLLKAAVMGIYRHRSIAAGDYVFSKPENLWTIARRLVEGDQELVPVKITIPEGATAEDIAWIILKKIPEFNAPYFIKISKAYEGYLFPDTYIFYPNKTPEEILATLRKTFDEKFKSFSQNAWLSKRSTKEIVTIASILEKETASSSERTIISGILWKRLDEGMLLQVDVDPNTYKVKGLPGAPIANPGLDALRAAVLPTKTPYYYFISDAKGVAHYATTFEKHRANIERYLK